MAALVNLFPSMNRNMIVVGLSFSLLLGCDRTVYSDRKVIKAIEHVRVGDPVDSVYQKMGVPLWIGVNPDYRGDGIYDVYVEADTSLKRVKELSSNPKLKIALNYSRSGRGDDDYYAYWVSIIEGKVVDTGKGVFLD